MANHPVSSSKSTALPTSALVLAGLAVVVMVCLGALAYYGWLHTPGKPWAMMG